MVQGQKAEWLPGGRPPEGSSALCGHTLKIPSFCVSGFQMCFFSLAAEVFPSAGAINQPRPDLVDAPRQVAGCRHQRGCTLEISPIRLENASPALSGVWSDASASVSGQLLCFGFLWALLNMDDLGKLLFFHTTERETPLAWNMEIIVIQALFKFYLFF